jgi:hypothetical protein
MLPNSIKRGFVVHFKNSSSNGSQMHTFQNDFYKTEGTFMYPLYCKEMHLSVQINKHVAKQCFPILDNHLASISIIINHIKDVI